MARALGQRTTRSFDTRDPAQLKRDLERFYDEVLSLKASSAPPLLLPDLVRYEETTLLFDRTVRIDPAGGAVVARLPPPSPNTSGRIVGVAVVGTGSVVLTPPNADTLVNGAAALTLSGLGLYLALWDGVGWWTVAGNLEARVAALESPAEDTIEFVDAATLAGVTTGALTIGGLACGSGRVDRIVICAIGTEDGTIPALDAPARCNGVPMRLIDRNAGAAQTGIALYYLLDDDLPSESLTSSIVVPDIATDMVGCAICLRHARQEPPFYSGTEINTATPISNSQLLVPAGAWGVDALVNDDAADDPVADAGQTERCDGAGSATVRLSMSTKPQVAAGTLTMGWGSLTAQDHLLAMIYVRPAEV